MANNVDFGTDINRSWQPSPTGDFQLVSGVDNPYKQFIIG